MSSENQKMLNAFKTKIANYFELDVEEFEETLEEMLYNTTELYFDRLKN
jgi:hypothetical protein